MPYQYEDITFPHRATSARTNKQPYINSFFKYFLNCTKNTFFDGIKANKTSSGSCVGKSEALEGLMH